ncbi:MAG: site-specific integrase [Candidatus Methanomethylophilus sp.]|jgi:integrase|nr:site-specific integrase [Methanomethylophilus sp.]MCI2093273.1 site-specific integrase [Methanomethylophilus sp.]
MARAFASWKSAVDAMIRGLRMQSNLKERSLEHYRQSCCTVLRAMDDAGRGTLPNAITEEDVRWLLDYMRRRNLTVATSRGYYAALRRYLRYFGNRSADSIKIMWPDDSRPNVDWLTPAQAKELLALPKDPVDEMIVHCGLCLGMRRVEILRLTPDSFHGIYVDILGKGHGAGKPRRMPYHRDTQAVLSRYLAYRKAMIGCVLAARPSAAVPDALLIWVRGHAIHTFGEKGTGIDSRLKKLAVRIGYPALSSHTLRRTFGRAMFHSGIPPATIAKMLGHSSIEQTLRYIGVDMDDMTDAMRSFILRCGAQSTMEV